jgi:membrane-associated phospholipid phosphatase
VRAWEPGSVVFFVYLSIAAVIRGPARGRARALVAAVAGLLLSVASARISDIPILHAWLLPPILLLTAYWGTGALFVAPMPSVERRFRRIDDALRIRSIASRLPRALAEVLEAAYSGVYPAIPVALWIALGIGVDAAHFWAVVLFTDYICFGCLPWIQSRPPRALEHEPPWRSRWRAVNLHILESGSVGVNTFPSGHAAGSLAVALGVVGVLPAVGIALLVLALAISLAAVVGRYHYTVDIVAGVVLALALFLALR